MIVVVNECIVNCVEIIEIMLFVMLLLREIIAL